MRDAKSTRWWTQQRKASWAALALLALAACPAWTHAQDWLPESVGMRYGMSATSLDDLFWQLEPDVRWALPWEAGLGEDWRLQLHLSVTAGWLASRGNHGFIASSGPLLSLSRARWPVRFEGGLSPTLLGRYQFGSDDFGSHLQFTSHAALLYDFWDHWSAGYRFQHMSNAGLGDPNPGLNQHALELFFRF